MNSLVEFREVAGCPTCRLGDDGSVLLLRAKKVSDVEIVFGWRAMDFRDRAGGYRQVRLDGPNGSRVGYVHRLILMAFVGPPPQSDERVEVRHLNGNPFDNRVSNLAWGTARENNADKGLHGTDNRGSKHPLALLDEEKVREIKVLLARGIKGSEIARQFRIAPMTVSNIKSGRSWRHVQIGEGP